MSISVTSDDRIADVRFPGLRLEVELRDGRILSTPLSWYPRLQRATPEQRERWELSAGGRGIHWPGIDEDLSVEGMLRGQKAPGGK
jgi:hypothetical protein